MKSVPLTNLIEWFDERTGLREKIDEALNEPIRGGARWAYVFTTQNDVAVFKIGDDGPVLYQQKKAVHQKLSV